LWLATGYCLLTGLTSFAAISLLLTTSWDMALSLAPWWVYATSYVTPIARMTAGTLLLRRSTHGVAACCASAAWTGVHMVVAPVYWQALTGAAVSQPPLYAAASRADLVLLAVIAWATFGWKKRGALWRR
jgi:hypothetical protein